MVQWTAWTLEAGRLGSNIMVAVEQLRQILTLLPTSVPSLGKQKLYPTDSIVLKIKQETMYAKYLAQHSTQSC